MKKTNAMQKPELEFIELDMLDVITASSSGMSDSGGNNDEGYGGVTGGDLIQPGQPIQ